MNWFHQHKWVEVARVTIPGITKIKFGPIEGPAQVVQEETAYIRALLTDRTSVHLRCSVCGDLKSVMLAGIV